MAFLLGERSAVEWFRMQRGLAASTTRWALPYLSLEASRARLERHLSRLEQEGLAPPYSLIVSMRDMRRSSAISTSRLMTTASGAFLGLRIDKGLYASPPEAVLPQVMGHMDMERITVLAFELCGRFGIRDGRVFLRESTCTREMVLRQLDEARHVRGRRVALAALGQVREGAGSPMEAVLAMALCAPVKWGGFDLPWPELNRSLPVAGKAAALWDDDFITPDLLWEDAHLCIEYDSDENHTASEKIAIDAARRDVLEEMGYRVVTVTTRHLQGAREVERIARIVAGQLGAGEFDGSAVARASRAGFLERLRRYATSLDALLGEKR